MAVIALRQGVSPNETTVRIGALRLYFSYEEVVGYQIDGLPKVVSENVWSKTTATHLNRIDGGDKKSRLPYADFQTSLTNVLRHYGLEV